MPINTLPEDEKIYFMVLSTVVVLLGIIVGVESSLKWRTGRLTFRRTKRSYALFLWDRGLTEVFRKKNNYISTVDEERMLVKIEDRRLLRMKTYVLKFDSPECFNLVKEILHTKSK